MSDPNPLAERALRVIGPRQYAIEGAGFASAEDEASVWHIDMGAEPAPVCDCPAFFSSQADPATCKHIAYMEVVEQHLNAAKYTKIFGSDDQ